MFFQNFAKIVRIVRKKIQILTNYSQNLFHFKFLALICSRRPSFLCGVVCLWSTGSVTVCVLVQAGSVSVNLQSTDVFDMVPFSTVTPLVPSRASNGCPPPPPTSLPPDMSEPTEPLRFGGSEGSGLTVVLSAGKDLFGAEPFDPFTCGAADFPPDIQSKLDEMQVRPGSPNQITSVSVASRGRHCY